jgi:hypothetical protein
MTGAAVASTSHYDSKAVWSLFMARHKLALVESSARTRERNAEAAGDRWAPLV